MFRSHVTPTEYDAILTKQATEMAILRDENRRLKDLYRISTRRHDALEWRIKELEKQLQGDNNA